MRNLVNHTTEALMYLPVLEGTRDVCVFYFVDNKWHVAIRIDTVNETTEIIQPDSSEVASNGKW